LFLSCVCVCWGCCSLSVCVFDLLIVSREQESSGRFTTWPRSSPSSATSSSSATATKPTKLALLPAKRLREGTAMVCGLLYIYVGITLAPTSPADNARSYILRYTRTHHISSTNTHTYKTLGTPPPPPPPHHPPPPQQAAPAPIYLDIPVHTIYRLLIPIHTKHSNLLPPTSSRQRPPLYIEIYPCIPY